MLLTGDDGPHLQLELAEVIIRDLRLSRLLLLGRLFLLLAVCLQLLLEFLRIDAGKQDLRLLDDALAALQIAELRQAVQRSAAC